MDFRPQEVSQIKLFDNSNPRHKTLMSVLVEINYAIGAKKD